MTSVFEVNGQHVHTHAYAAGPWDPQLQHGGAPASLVVWVAEHMPTRVPMQITRLTVDLLRPVPIAPLEIESEVAREGRKIQLCNIRLRAAGVEVVRASVLKTRIAPIELPPSVVEPRIEVPGPEALEDDLHFRAPEASFSSGVTVRSARGGFDQLGPAAIWFRAHRPIVAGEPISPAMRAVLAADFSNGVASALDFDTWTFINGDLTVSFARQPIGEWILLDAEAWIGPDGAGIASARLADQQGYFGRSLQNLVIERR